MVRQAKASNFLFKSILFAMLLALFCPTPLPAQTDVSDFTVYDLEDSEIEDDFYIEDLQYAEAHQEPTITKIEARIPAQKTIQEYRNQNRFQYEEEQQQESQQSSWVSDIIMWIAGIIFKIIAFPPTRWALIIIVAILILLAIVKYTQVDFLPMLRKKNLKEGNGDDYTKLDENIDHDFDKLLNNAINDKNYRLAVRLLFLKNLKALSNRGLINWDKNKTNSNYLYEIKEAQLRNSFAQNSRIFDYIWYGEFAIDESVFNSIHRQYNQFHKDVMSHAI